MDTTFITIHDLSEDARILYSSDSIVDILGYTPDEVVNRSVWDWFYPEEVPIAKKQHSRGVDLDKAAVLAYARIKNRQGNYVSCECCFSVVYDVLVCCTSIYRSSESSQKRAQVAPVVRRMFASSPKDPRYHMLAHLSGKFSLGDSDQTHEPRAALFLNRFTRSLTIMYATSGIEQIIGISSEEMKGRSFFYLIQENCLDDVIRCLESAKGNDSIAYLRFRFRDPRRDDPPEATPTESEDETMTDVTSSEDESEEQRAEHVGASSSGEGSSSNQPSHDNSRRHPSNASHPSETRDSSRPSSSLPDGSPQSEVPEDIELEAVVSCTSDGLVVCLRRARPKLPDPVVHPLEPAYRGNVFVAPWAPQPMFLPPLPQPPPFPLGAPHPAMRQGGYIAPFQQEFMQSILDVGVFAWALTGINGCLSHYAKGKPSGGSVPPDGFPIWEAGYHPRHPSSVAPSGYISGSSSSNDPYGFGDPGLS